MPLSEHLFKINQQIEIHLKELIVGMEALKDVRKNIVKLTTDLSEDIVSVDVIHSNL